MNLLAEIVVQSHLSDSTIEISFNPSLAMKRIRFVKFIINRLDGDLTKRINPEDLWKEFLEKEGE